MGKYEVTQAQWQSVMGSNPSGFKNCGGDCPVEEVSWEDVQEFIGKLNARAGGRPYRLPTEAEWEYAARAGTTEERYGDLDEIAWYSRQQRRYHASGGGEGGERRGVCTTCWGTCGSGCRIGTEAIRVGR